jgi:PAS domain S-box-containing protein
MNKIEIEEPNCGRDAALPAILDSLSTCILTLDRRGKVSYTSRSCLKFAHENGVAWLQVEPGADYLAVCRDAAQQGDSLAQQASEGIDAVLAGRFSKMSLEYPSRGSIGRQRWFLMNVDPLPAEHGGVVISHIDITEHKQMETALAERDAKFRGIYECNIVPIAFWDLDGRITNANDAYLRLTGYSRSELEEGMLGCRQLTPPDYLRLDKEAIEEATTKGVCVPYEKDYLRRDGQRVPVLIGGGMLPGMADRGVVFAVDLTERKIAEEALRSRMKEVQLLQEEEWEARTEELLESRHRLELERKRYQDLFEFAPDGYLLTDLNGLILEANQAAEILLKCRQESLIGKPLAVFIAESDRQDFLFELNQLSKSEGVQERNIHVRSDDGSLFPAALRIAVVDDEHGKRLGFRWLLYDITERKHAEEALRESEEKNRAILHALPDLIFVQSKDGVYLDYHAKDPRALLVPPEQFIGKNMR